VVKRALTDIRKDVGEVSKDYPGLGPTYAQCMLLERRLLWVRRVLWGYFQRKFDQRDASPEVKRILETADDVVWSCYKEAFAQAGEALKPVPMAYIEPFYSPQALPRDYPIGWLKEKRLGDDFMAKVFTELPIPLVSMPPVCISAPWWLVYLGHEVGHHVQHDLDLVETFGTSLKAVAESDGEGPTEEALEANRWYNWGQEIFADLFSLYMMGGAAAWAMAELETHPDQDMARRKDRYPSPAARLSLLARIAKALGDREGEALLAADPSPQLEQPGKLANVLLGSLTSDLSMLPKMVKALTCHPLGPVGTMADLTSWDDALFCDFGEVYTWQAALADPAHEKTAVSRQAARLIVSAGVEEWRQIVGRDVEAWRKVVSEHAGRWDSIATGDQVKEPDMLPKLRRTALAFLAEDLLVAIERNRDVTTRAAAPAALEGVDEIAARISAQLSTAEFVEW
jgi:hypothetical protein